MTDHQTQRLNWWRENYSKALHWENAKKQADAALAAFDEAFPAPAEREPSEPPYRLEVRDGRVEREAEPTEPSCRVVNPEDQKVPGRDSGYAGVATEPDWIDHTPGDPMPCEPGQCVWVRFRSGDVSPCVVAAAMSWRIYPDDSSVEILQWKPAQ